MKYSVIADNGRKSVTIVSDNVIDIDIKDGNKFIARLTVRGGKVFNENDDDISTAT
jgi:hypothetical protein